jgi:hypothetical protein
MEVATEFDAGHEDFVLDMAFNFYGNRMIVNEKLIFDLFNRSQNKGLGFNGQRVEIMRWMERA